MPIITLPERLPADYDRQKFMLLTRNLGKKMVMRYGSTEKYHVIIESLSVRSDGMIRADFYYVTDDHYRQRRDNSRYDRLVGFDVRLYRFEEME